MAEVDETHHELYGPERNLRFHKIRNVLTKSHVLQGGEYNYTSDKLNKDVWRTSHSTDYSGAVLDPSLQSGTSSQLVHHFDMGNASGKLLDTDIFRTSTTMGDFHDKGTKKPEICGEKRIINWPDMAPRFMLDRRVGPSEYTSSFATDIRRRTLPLYPRVNTAVLQLPLDPNKFWRQRNTNFSLGSDNDGKISEQQRAFGRGSMAFEIDEKAQRSVNAVQKNMKDMDKVSHVFRGGDYNDIVGNFMTTVNEDFGPRTVPPGEAALQKKIPTGKCDADDEIPEEDEEDECYANINKLQKYAREITVPGVFKDAAEGRTYQNDAHFHFGHDDKTADTIYSKDFALSSMALRLPPFVKPTPNAGKLVKQVTMKHSRQQTPSGKFLVVIDQSFMFQLFHNDPNQARFGISSNSIDFQNHKYQPYTNSEGKTALELNLDKRDKDSIIMSCDLSRYQTDRQRSLNHSDFKSPPKDYTPMPLAERHRVYFDYLQTDEAMPYPPPAKDTSEAAHNFTGMFARGGAASNRRASRTKEAKNRLEDGRSTHFVVGYQPFDFSSETKLKFDGTAKNDQEIPAAGKSVKVHPKKLRYLTHSENMLDLQAADPHITNTREGLPARMAYRSPNLERAHTTSTMKKDYGPIASRSLTDAQIRVIKKYDRVTQKDISDSHYFHTDTSGRNNFRTTAMEDFITPESMTGRKYLAAR